MLVDKILEQAAAEAFGPGRLVRIYVSPAGYSALQKSTGMNNPVIHCRLHGELEKVEICKDKTLRGEQVRTWREKVVAW